MSYANGGASGQLAQAINYLINSAAYSTDLAQLRDSTDTYTISVDPNGTDGYEPANGTITWNPLSGLVIPMVGIQSAALALAHETRHAACHDRLGTPAYLNSQKAPVNMVVNGNEITLSKGISPDEQSATSAEQIVSQQLGGTDPARSSYHMPGTFPVRVTNPTFYVQGPVF